MSFDAPSGVFNSPFGDVTAAAMFEEVLAIFPELIDDSYLTIGLDGPAAESGLPNASNPNINVDFFPNPTLSFFTEDGGTSLLPAQSNNAIVYLGYSGQSNIFPDSNLRVLIAQITTAGSLSGTMSYYVASAQQYITSSFVGSGTFDPINAEGCTDDLACNYIDTALVDDGSCLYLDECGECGGDGIPDGFGDCAGNTLDALGECGGQCALDNDANGVCDTEEVYGCTYVLADNFNESATRDDGSCIFPCEGDVNANVFDWDGDYNVTVTDF